jgi:DNA-binding NarL/FixJ family response regulator
MMRVAIISNIRVYREGLAEILDRRPDIDVVGAAAEGEAALDYVEHLMPDVALLDMAMLDSFATVRLGFAPFRY